MQKKTGKRVAGQTPSNRPKKKMPSLTGQQKLLVAVAVILAVALIVVVACQKMFVRPDVGEERPQKEESLSSGIDYGDGIRPKADGKRKSEDFYTILILGRDTAGGGQTDTMLLASYDVTNQKATVMSIPRDTMVNVSWDVKKINSVYSWYGGGDRGIQALYKEIAQLVGFEPDFEVIVEWEAVGKLVDAIGGVWFDVPYNMDYHDEWQDLVIEQEKGYRLLNGDDAMQVIRWRKNDRDSAYGRIEIGDTGRMQMQQDFLKAVIEQMMKPANVMNIGKIAQVFQECVDTDLSFQEILWFGQQAVSGGLSTSNVEFLTMPWKDGSAWSRTYHQKLSYVVPAANQLLEIINNKLSPFAEPFQLSDMDIMYINADGSVGSTSGHVEDSEAAVPPESAKPETPPETETPSQPSEGEGEEPQQPADPENPGIQPPEEGEGGTEAPGIIEPEPVDPENPEQEAPPKEIPLPEEPGEAPDFIIIEPPPAL